MELIKLENNEDQTVFELCNKSAMVYHHVQDLKALGIEINPKNDDSCRKMLNTNVFDEETHEYKKNQRNNEVTCMTNIKLSEHISLKDFLRLDLDDAMLYANNEILRFVVKTNDLMKYFPIYAYFIKLQYCRVIGSVGIRKQKSNFEISNKTKHHCLIYEVAFA